SAIEASVADWEAEEGTLDVEQSVSNILRRMRSPLCPDLHAQQPQQLLQAAIVADDHISPGPDQPLSLPGIDARAALLLAGYADGHTAGAADFFDLDETVAKAQQAVAAHAGVVQDLPHDLGLGEILVVVQRAVN